jgi:hypothetical protein
MIDINGTTHFKNVNNCLNINIVTSGGQSSNLYFNVVHFSTPLLIKHLWQLKAVFFLHWCLICTLLLINDEQPLHYQASPKQQGLIKATSLT